MSDRTWKANVRLSNGLHQQVQVRAGSLNAARAMIESMHGSGCILQGPGARPADAMYAIAAISGVPLLVAATRVIAPSCRFHQRYWHFVICG
jgi:hypothetical protein